MSNKLVKGLEIIWLVVSLLCLIAGIHQTYYEGFLESYLFFIFSLIAFFMYLLRKEIRKTKKDKFNG